MELLIRKRLCGAQLHTSLMAQLSRPILTHTTNILTATGTVSSLRSSFPGRHLHRSCGAMAPPRILLCGDVFGRLNQLFKRVFTVIPSYCFSSHNYVVQHCLLSINFRWINQLGRSTHCSAWDSSSQTRRSCLRSLRTSWKVVRKCLFRLTSLETTALELSKSFRPLRGITRA